MNKNLFCILLVLFSAKSSWALDASYYFRLDESLKFSSVIGECIAVDKVWEKGQLLVTNKIPLNFNYNDVAWKTYESPENVKGLLYFAKEMDPAPLFKREEVNAGLILVPKEDIRAFSKREESPAKLEVNLAPLSMTVLFQMVRLLGDFKSHFFYSSQIKYKDSNTLLVHNDMITTTFNELGIEAQKQSREIHCLVSVK